MANSTRRKLTAILAADIVGYSRLMETDEAGTFAQLKTHRKELIDPKIAEHHGRIVKITDDAMMVEFASVVDAVECAVMIQRAMAKREADVPEDRRVDYRMGINLGDVIIEGDDIYGAGVNIAARLEGLAEAGGLCISRPVYDEVKNKLDLDYEYLGEQKVKNIAEPVRVYRVKIVPGAAPGKAPALELPAKPSIAVLPFKNLSGDPEQEYFVDRITDNIITELSRFRGLFVIASNSIFTYKGKAVKVQEVARELGVQYILEGRVQSAGEKLRITAQLVDATTGHHVWAESYDRDLENLFAVQDEVPQKIVGALGAYEGVLERAERERGSRKPTESLVAYDYYLLGNEHVEQYSKEDNAIARQMYEQAIELDPGFARAYGGLSYTHYIDWKYEWSESLAVSADLALESAQKSVSLDPLDASGHWYLGIVVFYLMLQYEEGFAEFERALALNPNDATFLIDWGWSLVVWGKVEEGIEVIQKGMRLNPHYPDWYDWVLGMAYYSARRYEETIAAFKRMVSLNPESLRYLAASYARLGREAEARAVTAEILEKDPEFSSAYWADKRGYKNQADRDHLIDGLRKAGLPE